jgi:hypothetical protein
MLPLEREINRLSQKNILPQKTGKRISPPLSEIKVIIHPIILPQSSINTLSPLPEPKSLSKLF